MNSKLKLPDGVTITATISRETEEIFAPEAVELIVSLHRNFNQRRKEILQRREERQADLDAGKTPDFLAETQNVRRKDWTVAPIPADLQDRRVEITGPRIARWSSTH
jgi:malate synthase